MSSSNGKRDVLRSLDYVLYCHIAYTYFLDTSLLVLFLRILLQLVEWNTSLLSIFLLTKQLAITIT